MHIPSLRGLVLLCSAIAAGCSTARAPLSTASTPVDYRYFEAPDSGDGFSNMIATWQARQGSVGLVATPTVGFDVSSSPLSVAARSGDGDPDLRSKYVAFRQESRRRLAHDIVVWVQEQARQHYIPDHAIDHWATLEETFARNGDDCDGLELLAYHLLLENGFPHEDVYRSIVRRPSDGMHHMVTLWFETPTDPWVLDPTGTMTSRMERMSDIEGWEPVRIFSEESEYAVDPIPEPASIAAASR